MCVALTDTGISIFAPPTLLEYFGVSGYDGTAGINMVQIPYLPLHDGWGGCTWVVEGF
jgi:hypothetical protein